MNSNAKQFNEAKFNQAILYLISKSPNKTLEGKKKLAKLLYFVDFNFFEAYEKPFTGATYRALPMGPVPDQLEQAIKNLSVSTKELSLYARKTGLENDAVVFKATGKVSFELLSDQEKKVLNKVFNDYGNLSGSDLEVISHSEAPYNAVTKGEVIPYELAFYRGKKIEELTEK